MGDRVGLPPGTTKPRTSMTNIRECDFPNATSLSTVQQYDAPQTFGHLLVTAAAVWFPGLPQRRVLWHYMCGMHEFGAGIPLQRPLWHCCMEEHNGAVWPRQSCLARGSLLLALCLGLPGCKTGKISFVWLKWHHSSYLEKKKSLALQFLLYYQYYLTGSHEHNCISKSETILVTWHAKFAQDSSQYLRCEMAVLSVRFWIPKLCYTLLISI